MTPADAAELLTLAAAFDRRTVGEADARAWAAALHSMPLDDDARAAVARHYGETDRWLTPAHVRQQRARIRAERVNAATIVYDGIPGETGAESIARRRALLAAVADGRVAGPSMRGALGFSEERPMLALPAAATREERDQFAAERLAALGAYMPPDIEEALADHRPRRRALAEEDRPDPLGVPCPYEHCRADVRTPCKRGDRRRTERAPHPSRVEAALAARHQEAAA
ncbi:hypothetical protein SEA_AUSTINTATIOUS_40 [Streptomyces phage Austintatious]|uniref:DNA-binding phage zinc finger domain-containing protein n=1 Tax=Streptomyces phage Austintatious TaxID=2500795 RepID=A0A411AXH2_9CAUD|nr:hypothetical protein HOV10_gp40 [Streptomyces phage Austintatious]QAX92801.1 hypothetical protein SEA_AUSTINTATIOUS_40 [Streptomyces phage Austintatious]